MTYPLLMLVGKAGSGKDTAGQAIAKHFNGAKIALADPMKRILHAAFPQFTTDHLWGPSEWRSNLVSINDKRWEAEERLSAPHVDLDGDDTSSLRDTLDLGLWLADCMNHARGEGGYLTARYALQRLGTEYGREMDPLVWINHFLDTAEQVLGGRSYTPTKGITDEPSPRNQLVICPDGRFRNEILGIQQEGGVVFQVLRPLVFGSEIHVSETEQDGIPGHWYDGILMNIGGVEQLKKAAVDAAIRAFLKDQIVEPRSEWP